MRYDRTVIAYHGCDARTADRLIAGEPFRKSSNDFDWLGEGVYFWEYGYDRALRFAEEQRKRGKVERPAVVGALLQLGNCFDLMDTRFTADLKRSFPAFRKQYEIRGWPIPDNGGGTVDRLLRRRDCAMINFYLETRPSFGFPSYDSVRCCFTEGDLAFDGSGIYDKSHVQIAIRNQACILGTFRPGDTREADLLDPVIPHTPILPSGRPLPLS
jgi:hypothetical protein